MKLEQMPRPGKVRLSALGLLVVIGATVLGAMSLWSCCRSRGLVGRGPLNTEDVPIIRVRLTGISVAAVELSSTDSCRLVCDDDEVLAGSIMLDKDTASRDAGRWRIAGLSAMSDYLDIIPSLGGRVNFGGGEYRGGMRLVADGPDSFIVVNYIDLESYLAGVLAKELYGHWLGVTYRAQAIAARTFAMYQMTHFGRSRAYDLTDTQSSQVYAGFSGESGRAWDAVRATHGKVLAYGQAGREKVFLAHYSACCGGVVNSAAVLHEAADIAPLRGGQKCEHCAPCSRYRWSAVKVSKRELYQALKAVDLAGELADIKSIRVITRTSYGRAIRAELTDARGKTVDVRFDALRTSLLSSGTSQAKKLYSMNCEVRDAGDSVEFYNGHGFGHGVGLCQWGAQGKAKAGWSAERILKFYYPQAVIVSKY